MRVGFFSLPGGPLDHEPSMYDLRVTQVSFTEAAARSSLVF
jgi:hypothetical protein